MQYGQLNAVDPFAALHRDTQMCVGAEKNQSCGEKLGAFDTDTKVTTKSPCQDSCLQQAAAVTHQPLLFVEEVVKTHKRNLNRLGIQILHLERRYHKVCCTIS